MPTAPRPDERLLADCPPPQLVVDPDTATEEEMQVERIAVAESRACERQRRLDIVVWIRRVLFK